MREKDIHMRIYTYILTMFTSPPHPHHTQRSKKYFFHKQKRKKISAKCCKFFLPQSPFKYIHHLIFKWKKLFAFYISSSSSHSLVMFSMLSLYAIRWYLSTTSMLLTFIIHSIEEKFCSVCDFYCVCGWEFHAGVVRRDIICIAREIYVVIWSKHMVMRKIIGLKNC